ncbi:MAG: AgmX/PglI C-terminal domain-containing protein [Desulfobacteraceae bacterium]|jgi:pSer/pThr/pTyr-binding forkhead associated (FHA) protein
MKSNNSQNDHKPEPSNSPLAHFFIYENLNYVADSRISKEQISIGRSHNADLVLNHNAVADIHAFVHFEGRQAFLTNRYPDDGLHLNGRSVHLAKLQHEDVIAIGPFSLKVKIENGRGDDSDEHRPGQQTYSISLVNRYKTDDEMQAAVGKLAKQFKADPVKMALIIAKPEYVIKKDLSKTEAERWQVALQKSGIFCEIRVMKPEKPMAVRKVYKPLPAVQSKPADSSEPSAYEQVFSAESNIESRKEVKEGVYTENTVSTSEASAASAPDIFGADSTVWFDDDEDDEDNLWQAPFSLKEKLAGTQPSHPSAMQQPLNLQVIKTIGDRVVDVRYLGKGKKYTVSTEAGKLILASNKSQRSRFVCIAHDFGGYIKDAKGETTADLKSYKRSDYLFKKRQRFYRIPVPKSGEIVIQDGQSQYRVFNARSTQSPAVRVAQKPSEFTWKHWAVSGGTHLVLVLCLSIYWYFQANAPKPSMPHFVKIDPTILQQLQPKQPPKPPKVEPPPKPEPQRVAEKVEPPKKKAKKQPPKPIAKPTKSKRKIKKVAKAQRPSRHPKAGGGFGKGNIKNRNINQTGLLSVLGKTPLAGPSTAIASVTNLDAVPVPDAGDNNFSVGGVKGSLGNGKISVAGGEMLQTKGSGQVFRSAGAKGSGSVAALQRGSTGKKQVQGMVTAKMSRTVEIRGGMSREMVKRVIDQHLEQITHCYETALMGNPSIMGRIVFEWKIRMDGSVGQIRIAASSVNSHDIHNCIKAAIKSWQFPKPVGTEVVVSYPFVFDLVAF